MSSDLKPCPFCGAPGFAMLAAYGFKIKCTDTDCTVETPIRTHRHQVDALWNRRVEGRSAVPSSHVSETDEPVCIECGGPVQWRCPACKISSGPNESILREALARLIERSAEVSRVLFETNLDMRYGLLAQRRALDDELIAARSALAGTKE